MQNGEEFKALEAALAGRSIDAVEAADERSLREMAGPVAATLSDGFLRSARRLLLRRKQEARRRSQIDSIMPAVRQIWRNAGFADCGPFFCIYPDGLPVDPEMGRLVELEGL